MKRLFSAYVIVDWSAASKPTTGADSIWIGVMKRDVRFRLAFEAFNVPTRAEAERKLAAILDDFRKRGEKALVGFDFPLGFPRGFSDALKLAGDQPWLAVWNQIDRMVKDKPDNTNNRFGVASEVNRRITGGSSSWTSGIRPSGASSTSATLATSTAWCAVIARPHSVTRRGCGNPFASQASASGCTIVDAYCCSP